MKKINKITVFTVVLTALLASGGCNIFKPNNDDLLTDHLWKFDKITTTSTDETIQSLVAFTGAMMTGATLEFHTDGTYTLSMAGEMEDGTWELIDDDEVLLMDTDELIIIKLTKDELVLESEVVNNEYGTYTVSLYFEK